MPPPGGSFLIVGIGFYIAYQFVEPAPPTKIVITTGSESGAYYQFANRYAAILARNGITLEVRTSAGSLENLERLKNDEAQVGFVQGGVVELPDDPDGEDDSGLLVAGQRLLRAGLGFLSWRKALRSPDRSAGQAHRHRPGGLRCAPAGAATAGAPTRSSPATIWCRCPACKAAEELQQGRIDAAFIIAAENAPVVQVLLRSPGVKVMSFAQADAYQRRFPFLSKLTLPQGVADLVRDYPP